MFMRYLTSTVLVMAFCGLWSSATAMGAVFQSDAGYTLWYPDDWRVVPKEERVEFAERAGLPADFAQAPDVILVGPESEGFAPSVVVVLENGVNTIEDAMPDPEALRRFGKEAGLDYQVEALDRMELNGRPAISMHSTLKHPALTGTTRNWSIIVPSPPATYSITVVAPEDVFARHLETYSKILTSFETTAPLPSGRPGKPPYLIGLALLAVLGGGVAVWLFVKRRTGGQADPHSAGQS